MITSLPVLLASLVAGAAPVPTFEAALTFASDSRPLLRAASPADEPVNGIVAPTRPGRWVWLTSQGCWGFGVQRADGLWVIEPGSKRYPAPVSAPQPPVYQTPIYYYQAPALDAGGGCVGGACNVR